VQAPADIAQEQELGLVRQRPGEPGRTEQAVGAVEVAEVEQHGDAPRHQQGGGRSRRVGAGDSEQLGGGLRVPGGLGEPAQASGDGAAQRVRRHQPGGRAVTAGDADGEGAARVRGRQVVGVGESAQGMEVARQVVRVDRRG
jgi:hypothetical protein